MAQLPTTAQVVVIGGGIVGTSTLHHLTAAGCTDVLLIERESIGAGATSKAAGGFRTQFSDALNIRIALESIKRLSRFEEEFDVDIDFKQWGYLFLLDAPSVPSFAESIRLQNEMGVPSVLISPEEARQIVPELSIEDLAAATFCHWDGYCTPEAAAQGYARSAISRGATVIQGATVTAISTAAGEVKGVVTDQGPVSAEAVVCAAGVWSSELVGAVGLELPVTPEKRHIFLTDGPDPLPRALPLTIDFASGFYFQREGESVLFGGRESTIDDLAPHAVNRLPLLGEMPIKPGWWGYYGMSPDYNAIVGAAHEPRGLLYATGFSGHGFQQGPVVGQYLAERALGIEPFMDLRAFSVERFDGEDPKPEAIVV